MHSLPWATADRHYMMPTCVGELISGGLPSFDLQLAALSALRSTHG